jgi:hypothetical protein
MERSSGHKINQDSAGEAANIGLDLGERLSARHESFPGAYRLGTTLAPARRTNEFGGSRLAFFAKLQRRWSTDGAPPGWLNPVYAWPAGFMNHAARSAPPPGAPGSAESGSALRAIEGSGVRHLATSRDQLGGNAAAPLGNAPGASGKRFAGSAKHEGASDTVVRSIERATPPGGTEKSPDPPASNRRPDPKLTVRSPAAAGQLESASGRSENFLADSGDRAPTIESSARAPTKGKVPTADPARRVQLGSSIVRRRIGDPLQDKVVEGGSESLLVAPTSLGATGSAMPTPRPQLSAEAQAEDVKSAPKANRADKPNPAPPNAIKKGLASDSRNEGPPPVVEVSSPLVPPQTRLGAAIVKRHIGIRRLEAATRSSQAARPPIGSAGGSNSLPIQSTVKPSSQPRPTEDGVKAAPSIATNPRVSKHESAQGGPGDPSSSTRSEAAVPGPIARSRLATESESQPHPVPAVSLHAAQTEEIFRDSGRVVESGALRAGSRSFVANSMPGKGLGSAIFQRHSGVPQERGAFRAGTSLFPHVGALKAATQATPDGVGEGLMSQRGAPISNQSPAAPLQRETPTRVPHPGMDANQALTVPHPLGQSRGRLAEEAPIVRPDVSPASESSAPASAPRALSVGDRLQHGREADMASGVPRSSLESPERAGQAVPAFRLDTVQAAGLPLRAGASRDMSPEVHRVVTVSGGNFSPRLLHRQGRSALSQTETADEATVVRRPDSGLPAQPAHRAEPDPRHPLVHLDPPAPARTHLASGQTTGATQASGTILLPVESQSPVLGEASLTTSRPWEPPLPEQMPSLTSARRKSVLESPSSGGLTRLPVPQKINGPGLGSVPPAALPAGVSVLAGRAHNIIPDLLRRHQSVPVTRPLEYRLPRSSRVPGVDILHGTRTMASQAAAGPGASIEPAAQPGSFVNAGPGSQAFESHSTTVRPGPIGFADQAHLEMPIGSVASMVDRGAPNVFRKPAAGRGRFVVATSIGGADFSSRVFARVSAPWPDTRVRRTSAEASPSDAGRLLPSGTIRAGGRFPGANIPITGAPSGFFLSRFAVHRPSAPRFGGAWPVLQPEHSTAQLAGPQGPDPSQSSESPVILGFNSRGSAPGPGSNPRMIVSRFPASFGAAELPQGSTSRTEALSSLAPMRNVSPGQRPLHHSVQRQSQGAPSGGPNQNGLTANVAAQSPAPAPTAQNAGPDVAQLAEQVYGLIVRRIATERDRRGL